jgi:1L-myo-inositol 1-phosphate cytidylyltransferase
VTEALVLAAGNGDRFHDEAGRSKLIHDVDGVPLIARTLHCAAASGIASIHVVVGYREDEVSAVVRRTAPVGARVQFHRNPAWRLENGVSVLAAREALGDRPFAILMGDHLFDAATLRRLCAQEREPGEVLLAIDRHLDDEMRVAEATKVWTDRGHVVEIGKDLTTFDALDSGLFVADSRLFAALEGAWSHGDSTLTAGIRQLALERAVRGLAIVTEPWFDIDTRADLERAREVMATSR